MTISGAAAGEILYRRGLVPERCIRATFEFDANRGATVTYSVYADEGQVETLIQSLNDYLLQLKK